MMEEGTLKLLLNAIFHDFVSEGTTTATSTDQMGGPSISDWEKAAKVVKMKKARWVLDNVQADRGL